MVNPGGRVFVERARHRRRGRAGARSTEKNLQVAVRNIARLLGDDISEEQPILDARLPDGSRVAAVIPPCSLRWHDADHPEVSEPVLHRRRTGAKRHADRAPSWRRVTHGDRRAPEHPDQRRDRAPARPRCSTRLAALLAADRSDRVDRGHGGAAGGSPKRRAVRGAPRAARPSGRHDSRPAARRHCGIAPTASSSGEVRGGEAYDLLQALNTGHAGTLSTIHANSAQQALARLTSCVLQAGVELPYQAIRHQIADSIDVVLHLDRRHGVRRVSEFVRLQRYIPEQ